MSLGEDEQTTILSHAHSLPQEVKRSHLCKFNKNQLDSIKNDYVELLTELFFLQHGGNYIDYNQFKKRPSRQLLSYLDQNSLSSITTLRQSASLKQSTKDVPIKDSSQFKRDSVLEKKPSELPTKDEPIWKKIQTKEMPNIVLPDGYEESIGSQEEILERARQEAIVQRRVVELRKQGLWSQKRMPKVQEPPRSKTHWDYLLEEMRWLAADFAQERKWKRVAARKLARMVGNYHKDSMEREKKAAREEQQKLRRIASSIARQIRIFWSDIQKDRSKMAVACVKHLHSIYANFDQVVEYKQQCLLDEKRQKALDLHLNFIVDQTAKYSDWLTQGLTPHPNDSNLTSPTSQKSSTADSDGEFLPRGASTDDEETIAMEEDADHHDDTKDEIALLKEESEMPFDDLISQLPKDLIENIDKPFVLSEDEQSVKESTASIPEQSHAAPSTSSEVLDNQQLSLDETVDTKRMSDDDERVSEKMKKPSPISLRRSARKRQSEEESEVSTKITKTEPQEKDEEFVGSISSSDDEETLKEQEGVEDIDHKKEIEELQAEGDMPIEELLKLYGGAYDDTGSETSASKPSSQQGDSPSSSDEEELINEDIGVDYLLTDAVNKKTDEAKPSEPDKELTDVAAEAMSLQPTGHTLATTQVVTPIPPLLKHTLREYQHIGLDWLVTMYNKRLNGILADEMGLGKTIQTIALLAHLACDKGVWGPHLIVVPTSVILNWEMELKKWAPGFKILTYYGNQKERKMKRTGWTKSNAFHVCVTSYKLILQDHSSFRRKKWRYLILDEAQNIKNFKSQRWQALLNFNSQRRLLLTGTPLQNNLMELWSLMHFLMPHVFQSHKDFKEWFSNPLTGMIEGSQEFNEGLVQRLHQVLRPFILRRVKKDVEKQMPNKYEHVVKCHLSKRQRFLYEDFMSRTATKETLAGGHFMSVINVLMQLRKVCNHPNLFEPRPTLSPFVVEPLQYFIPSLVHKVLEKNPFEEFKPEDMNLHLPSLTAFSSHQLEFLRESKVSRKIIEQIDDETDPKPEKYLLLRTSDEIKSDIDLIFSLLITDAIKCAVRKRLLQIPQSEYVMMQRKNTNKTLNGSTGQATNDSVATELMDHDGWNSDVKNSMKEKMKNDQYAEILVRRKLSTRNATLHRLIRINELRCSANNSYMSANLIHLLTSAMDSKSSRLQHSTHIPGLRQDLKNFVLSKFVVDSRLQEMKEVLDRFVFVIAKVSSSCVHFKVSHPTPWRYYALTTSQHILRHYLSKQLALYHDIRRNANILFPETRLIQYDCGKLQILNVLLRRFWSEKHRILIFTQMTKVLDILEMFLNYHGYRYLRLDGSTAVEERMARMERFNNDPRIFCFILSTRSGGIGVNLTGADTVVFYDSDWNPTMDAQAQDRCHRIGQTRDVHIYRLISEKTIEENILKKANQKRLLGDLAIEGGEFTTAFFKQQQIRDLFDEPSGLDELLEPSQPANTDKNADEEVKEEEDIEEALLKSEEKEDVDAAALLKKEQDAVMEEFEDVEEKKQDAEETGFKLPKGSKVKAELKKVYEQLTPIERYALHLIEASSQAVNDMELQEAEAQVEQSKREWKLAHVMALKEEEERRMEEADEIFYTREDNQVNLLTSSSSSSSEDDDRIRKPRVRAKQAAKKQKKDPPRVMRGRGRGPRGLSRMELKRKRVSSEESSESVYVDDVESRDGDPLWREYEQEIGGMESDDMEEPWLFEDDQVPFSDEEDPSIDFPDAETSPMYRESPLWKVAAQSEKLIHEKSAPEVDYGPNEIMSFSKSGRPRKRNKRLCEDEYEVFSPGSGFLDSSISVKTQNPTSKPAYSVVIETSKKKPSKKSVKSANISSAQLKPDLRQLKPQQRVLVPISLVSTGTPITPLVPGQSRLGIPLSSVNTVISSHQSSVLVSQGSFMQPLQWTKPISPGTVKPLLLNLKSSQPFKARVPVAPKPDNLFELDFTLESADATNSTSNYSPNDDLITLNLEPVNVSEESFFEPSNEEERNVFESFASLLQ